MTQVVQDDKVIRVTTTMTTQCNDDKDYTSSTHKKEKMCYVKQLAERAVPVKRRWQRKVGATMLEAEKLRKKNNEMQRKKEKRALHFLKWKTLLMIIFYPIVVIFHFTNLA